jgi:hypothetical protein
MKKPKHPIQPIMNVDGVHRFRDNKIVRFLLDAGPYDLNKLALMNFSRADQEQFAQLIGYSVSGWGDLSYVRGTTYARAKRKKVHNG